MKKEEESKLLAEIANLKEKIKNATHELRLKDRALEIESALEKVRARTIGMRQSTELAETSAILFQQLRALRINPIRTGVGIFDDANEAMELWLTTVSDSQEVIKILDYFSLHIHPVFENIIPARQQKNPYSVTVLRGNEVRDYYRSMSTYLSLPNDQVYRQEEFFYSFFFEQGTLNVITSLALTEEECNIMIQFASVFGLIYTRFLDLQKAEAQTRDALRQTSLDRVRGEIASMRTADDLERITPLIWQELVNLGVPFFRSGVFIVSEHDELVSAYLSTPAGKSLAVLRLPFGSSETIRLVVENWRSQKVYTELWDGQQFDAWVQSMLAQGQITDARQYQPDETPVDSLSLHFIPFTQGMLYVGSHEYLDDSNVDLAKSLADSFAIAYARFEDFKQLEDAKDKVEGALSELKATQSQLIQSEKMASLGELTAGIAHEIQNPLNFVNNFSEVNHELLEEMNAEIEKGNFAEARALAKSISANEEKIIHHGKRADAIVKGMLLHSRTSAGLKEITDINALADEYLRLAYHGLRAKDKSFSATMKTEFDPSIKPIEVIPQDIGRVILNLITNGFYAVSEKKKQNPEGYDPTVTVSTSQSMDREGRGDIVIKVTDNGNGIPDNVIEKIFQPFFTTKPTGQGTGLGLSLSYDILRAHGGELKVGTTLGKGSEFVITLPVA